MSYRGGLASVSKGEGGPWGAEEGAASRTSGSLCRVIGVGCSASHGEPPTLSDELSTTVAAKMGAGQPMRVSNRIRLGRAEVPSPSTVTYMRA